MVTDIVDQPINEVSSAPTSDVDGSGYEVKRPSVVKRRGRGLTRTPRTRKSGSDKDHTGVADGQGFDSRNVQTDCGGEFPAKSNDSLNDRGLAISHVRHSTQLINKLQSEIAKLKDNMRENEYKHASEIAIRDQ